MSADKRSQSGGREEAFRAALYVSRQSSRASGGCNCPYQGKAAMKSFCLLDTFWFHAEKFSFSTIVSLKLPNSFSATLLSEHGQ